MKIAVAGWQHETNTFSPIKADLNDFELAGSWPAMAMGEELLAFDQTANIPISGFLKEASKRHQLIPIIWSEATPSGKVTERAATVITDRFLSLLKQVAHDIDALYIDFHGAMVSEIEDDQEGALLLQIREIIGNDIPIVCSLDLHANVTQMMVEQSTLLVAYRTYPHIDMRETGKKTAILLDKIVNENLTLKKSYRQLPYLIPMTAQCTMEYPANKLYDFLSEIPVFSTSICLGFPLSDTYATGPSVLAYDVLQQNADDAVEQLYNAMMAVEPDFALKAFEPEEGVALAQSLSLASTRPIILADTQDNSGCGGSADTTGILHALVAAKIPSACVVAMADENVAKKAHAAGEGAMIEATFSDRFNQPANPITLQCSVARLGNGEFIGTGPFYKNCQFKLGKMALLDSNGIKIIVTSKKVQAADQAILTCLGVHPQQEKIIVVKSSVHFRADFSRIAEHIYIVIAPGLNTANLKTLIYRKLRDGVRY